MAEKSDSVKNLDNLSYLNALRNQWLENNGPHMTFKITNGPDKNSFAQNYFSLSDPKVRKPYFQAVMMLSYLDDKSKAHYYPGEFKFEFHSFFSADPKTNPGFMLWVKVFYRSSNDKKFQEFKFPGQPYYITQVKIFGTYNLHSKDGMCGVEIS